MTSRAFHGSESVEKDISHFERRDTRMTRVHFRIIAEGFAASRPGAYPDNSNIIVYGQWWDSINQMATRLAETNPNFDRDRFIMWCEE